MSFSLRSFYIGLVFVVVLMCNALLLNVTRRHHPHGNHVNAKNTSVISRHRRVFNTSSRRIASLDTGSSWERYLCRWTKNRIMASALVMDVFIRDVRPSSDSDNIFLIETSCLTTMTSRTLCALESFAKHNPDSVVWLLVTSGLQDNSDGLLSSLLARYSNIKLAAVDLDIAFQHTPLQYFYDSDELLYSRYVNVQMSDILRVAVVWRFGGLYSDSDSLCLKPLSSLRNCIAFEKNNSIANAVFHFEKEHPYLVKLMHFFPRNYDPFLWTSMGPLATTALTESYCNKPLSELHPTTMSQPTTCNDVRLLPENTFYPLPWRKFRVFMTDPLTSTVEKEYPDTYILHLTGSSSVRVAVDTIWKRSFYAHAAKKHCPHVYGMATVRNRFI